MERREMKKGRKAYEWPLWTRKSLQGSGAAEKVE
jgi:hypothetical protein